MYKHKLSNTYVSSDTISH